MAVDVITPVRGRRRTPKLLKRFLQSRPFRAFLYFVLANYVRLIKATTRWSVIGREIPERFWNEKQGMVCAFWHGRNAIMPVAWDVRHPLHMLASQHRDGDITENVLGKLGIKAIRGSTGNPAKAKMAKGGASALRAMARLVQSGESIAITPDGPRGPRMRAGDGIVAAARFTAAPVITCGAATRAGILLNTWDRLFLPLPFSRGTIVYGGPIFVARDAGPEELEQARRAIEDEITRVTQEADRLSGRAPVEPAPVAPAPQLAAAAP